MTTAPTAVPTPETTEAQPENPAAPNEQRPNVMSSRFARMVPSFVIPVPTHTVSLDRPADLVLNVGNMSRNSK